MPVDWLLRGNKVSVMPTVVFVVKGYDFLGRPVVKAYGSTHLPLQGGQHTLSVGLYRPVAFTWWERWTDWLRGSSKEFNRIEHSIGQG